MYNFKNKQFVECKRLLTSHRAKLCSSQSSDSALRFTKCTVHFH